MPTTPANAPLANPPAMNSPLGDRQPSPDLTILGAGIIGLCCAMSAVEAGLRVRIIDKQEPGQATSYGNAGIISPWSVVPQCMPGVWKNVPRWLLDPNGPVKVRWRHLPETLPWAWSFLSNGRLDKVTAISQAMAFLMQDNIEIYRRHLKGTSGEELVADSHLLTIYRGRAQPSLNDPGLQLRMQHGARVELLGGNALREIEPAIGSDYHSAVLVKDQARALDPGRICTELSVKLRALGVEFVFGDVQELLPKLDGTVDIIFEGSKLKARKLVLAAGAWSTKLLIPLGFRMPLIAERGYHLEFKQPEVVLKNSVQDDAGKVILSSMNGGIRIAGTAEFADVNAPMDERRAQALLPIAKRILPGLKAEPVVSWMGARPSFPDNLPAIGPLPGCAQIITAFGHSHWGLGMAPRTGELIAGIASNRLSNADLTSISPARFLS